MCCVAHRVFLICLFGVLSRSHGCVRFVVACDVFAVGFTLLGLGVCVVCVFGLCAVCFSTYLYVFFFVFACFV